MSAIEKIEAQQKGKEGTPAWMVGQQLKEICRREPQCGELVEKDLDAINLDAVAAKLKAYADEQHKKGKGNCVCITPDVAEGIIRKAYGLPDAAQEPIPEPAREEKPKQEAGVFLDLADFLI